MKRRLTILMIWVLAAQMMSAQTVETMKVSRPAMERSGDYLKVSMDIRLSGLDVESNRAVLLTPVIVKGESLLTLPSVGVYGRNRYYHYVRNGESMLSGKDEVSYRGSQMPDSVAVEQVVPFQEWMDGAQLVLWRRDYGCCSRVMGQSRSVLLAYHEPPKYVPQFVYVRPKAERRKTRSYSGSAFIDFPVNQTYIAPNYRNNLKELDKITGTIDAVKRDSDMTITALFIKGFASPEGAYKNNERLAKGRTEALKDYVQELYHFQPSIMKTDSEPEDWAGLKAYVEQSSLPNKEAILAIIDSDDAPDLKDWKIKRRYAADYKVLLNECYPALRHSDYKVEYIIRSYTDVEEIKRIFLESPQKLSLDEFYHLAEAYEPGSSEFDEVFETAVRMYPSDPLANLNAANAVMQMGNSRAAERYLAKAGDGAEAVYARGIHAALIEDYPAALTYFRQAKEKGIAEAEAAIEVIEKMNK